MQSPRPLMAFFLALAIIPVASVADQAPPSKVDLQPERILYCQMAPKRSRNSFGGSGWPSR
jgi:hypothetical protein